MITFAVVVLILIIIRILFFKVPHVKYKGQSCYSTCGGCMNCMKCNEENKEDNQGD